MRRAVFIFILLFSFRFCYATHIIGGEAFYEYKGIENATGKSLYKVSLRLFRDCNVVCGGNVACLPEVALMSVYENGHNFSHVDQLTMPLEDDETFSLDPQNDNDYPHCLTSRPAVCYEVKTYSTTIALPDNDIGYLLAYENCCRATTINVLNKNTYSQLGQPGAVYDCVIPGTNVLPAGHNSSAVFHLKKPDLVCYNSKFNLDYTATDPDGDSLSFIFASALSSGSGFAGANDEKAADPPPYNVVSYNTNQGFNSGTPFGRRASLNSVTGEISGVSPSAGFYVVCVLVYEWRNKKAIARHRKDFIVRVQTCNIPEAILEPSYLNCSDYELHFSNESPAANVNSYYWDFGDASSLANTSVLPQPAHLYPKAGTYQVKLVVNRGAECSDSTTTEAKIYPGLVPGFNISGSCLNGDIVFSDNSTTVYGQIATWFWNFGYIQEDDDRLFTANPTPQRYAKAGKKQAKLVVGNDKGCVDSLTKFFWVYDTSIVHLPLTDTLICNLDTVQISASSNGKNDSYAWTPDLYIQNAATQTPLVHPQQNTVYHVNVTNDHNCTTTDSLLIRVTDHADLAMPADTLICLTDTVHLSPVSNGQTFIWSPAETLSSPAEKNTFAVPAGTTTYHLQASLGSCKANDKIIIHTVPYPVSKIEDVSPICFGAATMLHASSTGTDFTWSPTNTLLHTNTLTPLAGPSQTTVYTLTVADHSPEACPKVVSDSITVVVIQPLQVSAGRDTNIVAGQKLQLQASGAEFYHWQPSIGMNNADVANPVVYLPENISKLVYEVKGRVRAGCSATDSITVYQYKTLPEIFVPSAFTPNNDGINDIIKPIAAGIKTFIRFRIYNRWGDLLYSTSSIGQGWDGNHKGKLQPGGTYVYEALAIDYLDKTIARQGTFVLIR